jgi:RND family efflux transporter MFP subunit
MVCAGVIALAGLAGACAQGASDGPETASATGRPPVAVTIAPVVSADLVEAVEVVGSLAPKFSADVKSEVSGLVTQVFVTEWVPVRKGARLARLDTSETEAAIDALKAGEAQARVAETRARREHDRAQQLKQYGLITPQNLDDAQSALEAAQAGVEAASAQIRVAQARLQKAFIAAPMDGVVALRAVNVGDRVENMGSGDPLFRIVNNGLLDLTLTVPSSKLATLRLGQPVEFQTDAVPGQTFTGKVMFVNPTIDEASRAVKVVAEVRNADGRLKGGLFVKGRIVSSNRPGVVQVPREALLNWDVTKRAATVYVVKNGQAEKRAVQTGHANGQGVEIVAGLTPGEQVVTRGGFALRPGDKVTVANAGEGA